MTILDRKFLIVMTLLSSRRAAAFLSSSGRTFSSSLLSRAKPNAALVTTQAMAKNRWASSIKSTKEDTDNIMEESQVPRKFKPYPFQYHEELTLTVEGLTNRGIGICRVPIPESAIPIHDYPQEIPDDDDDDNDDLYQSNSKGWVVMIPNTIPGETIRCKVYRNFGSYSEADLVEILEESPHRVTPVCPLADECGGCQYQHMDTAIQREWKTEQVQDLLERIGKLDPDTFPSALSTVGTDEVYHYRSKITPHYDRPIKVDIGDMKVSLLTFGCVCTNPSYWM